VRKVSIESPLKPIGRHGSSEEDHKREYEENVAYARAAMLDCIQRGEAPFASHLLYTQVLDDAEADERKTGMRAGMHIGDAMDARVVYIDLGVSVGMRAAITRAINPGVSSPRLVTSRLRSSSYSPTTRGRRWTGQL